MIETDCIIVGAGMIGLAIARALADSNRQVFVLEHEALVGSHTSSRNSEVVHAGIYYDKDSLKAKHCIRGKQLLYEYCQAKNIAVNRIGKLIVSCCPEQENILTQIQRKASANGVDDICWVEKDRLQSLEPDLNATAALYSPSTGIIDSHSFMLNLRADIEDAGSYVLTNHTVTGGRIEKNNKKILTIETDNEVDEVSANTIINCAGLYSTCWLQNVTGFSRDNIPTLHFAKGSYFSLAGKSPFNHLIYPLPDEAGLGIHLTIDLGGKVKFGPDVEWITSNIHSDHCVDSANLLPSFSYDVDYTKLYLFYDSIHQYYPALDKESLIPGYSGIRPKLSRKGELAADFMIQDFHSHGINGWINLFGIESPGLTASLSLAIEVSKRIESEKAHL